MHFSKPVLLQLLKTNVKLLTRYPSDIAELGGFKAASRQKKLMLNGHGNKLFQKSREQNYRYEESPAVPVSLTLFDTNFIVCQIECFSQ